MSKTKQPRKMNRLERQERVQKRELNLLAKQERWLRWAVVAILVLLLFLLLAIGYATGWFKGDDRDKVSQTPLSGQLADGSSGQATSTTGGGTDSAQRQTTTNGSTNSTTRETTNTNTSTTNKETNNNTTTPAPGNPLINLNGALNTGDSIKEIKELADSLNITYSCNVLLILAVEECVFGVGDLKITTRSLTLNGLITGITDNF